MASKSKPEESFKTISKKLERARLLEQKIKLKEGLPHLYGFPWYPWAKRFFTSTNPMNLLVAANQISKSSTQIRKCIHWATAVKEWPKIWRSRPLQFWYLYPSKDQATVEFDRKWIPEFLPRGEFKDHPEYGWKEEYRGKDIFAVHFNTGVSVYFKTYAQDAQHLQTGTCHAIFCFTAGTKISTPSGAKRIEELRVGDWVHTHAGPRRIRRTMSKLSPIIEKVFSNGQSLEGTPEHPIWTDNRGWVQLGLLTPEDICHSVPECETTLSSYYLKANCTPDSQSTATPEPEIISGDEKNSYMSHFGNRTMDKRFQRDLSSTTKMTNLWIIVLKIWSVLLGRSILDTIKNWSGSVGKHTLAFVNSVRRSLQAAVHIELYAFAGGNVPVKPGYEPENVFGVKKTSAQEKIQSKCSVVKAVQTKLPGNIKRVYNIEVADSHTYFANGILVHNCDEELPEELLDELLFRLAATDGYFHMVFTATLGQEFWREAMEVKGEGERFPDAFKQTISYYECLEYEDGSPSSWTIPRIKRLEAMCKNPQEIARRIHGRFVKDSGLKYPSFDITKNVKRGHLLPQSWHIYGAVDIGSGGKGGHPAGIVFMAVNPEFTKGRVFKAWRGDGIDTTASDILAKFMELRGKMRLTAQYYDHSSKDFYNLAARVGEPFLPAEKSHSIGENILNTLFKNGMLEIYSDDPECAKLVQELCSLTETCPKTKAKDDLIDPTRYIAAKVPWDWSSIAELENTDKVKDKPAKTDLDRRREGFSGLEAFALSADDEMEAWNELYEI